VLLDIADGDTDGLPTVSEKLPPPSVVFVSHLIFSANFSYV